MNLFWSRQVRFFVNDKLTLLFFGGVFFSSLLLSTTFSGDPHCSFGRKGKLYRCLGCSRSVMIIPIVIIDWFSCDLLSDFVFCLVTNWLLHWFLCVYLEYCDECFCLLYIEVLCFFLVNTWSLASIRSNVSVPSLS